MIEIQPMTGAIGALIHNVNLSRSVDDGTWRKIHEAFLAYNVISFPDQDLTPEKHMEFARHFGPLTVTPYIAALPDYPLVCAFVREADERREVKVIGGDWHCDESFYEVPSLGTALYGLEVPPFGGDTLFSSFHLAYDALSDGMKEMLERLVLITSARVLDVVSRDPTKSYVAQKGVKINVDHDPHKEVEHPLVQIHPETGRKLLWVPGFYAIRFKGMTEEESKPLLDYLKEHAHRPAFTCRVKWTPRMLTIWDNRCLQHFAINDYQGHRRVMQRVQIGGTRPFGPAMPAPGVQTAA